ncbi:hypothetical protein [Sphingobium sp. RSMS]|uniref:hypothetical protein n=1 Tax=Sphingobium sp. RSMS TaxID=520734 RepID=UPI0010F6169F|nr:hypothetical protein [Sphingobium sp. RSMS]
MGDTIASPASKVLTAGIFFRTVTAWSKMDGLLALQPLLAGAACQAERFRSIKRPNPENLPKSSVISVHSIKCKMQ